MSTYKRFRRHFDFISIVLRRKGVHKDIRQKIVRICKQHAFDMETYKLREQRWHMFMRANILPHMRNRYNKQVMWIKQLVEVYEPEVHDVPVTGSDGNLEYPQLMGTRTQGWLNHRLSNFETRYFWQRLYPTAEY
jgi:hypothetical protein